MIYKEQIIHDKVLERVPELQALRASLELAVCCLKPQGQKTTHMMVILFLSVRVGGCGGVVQGKNHSFRLLAKVNLCFLIVFFFLLL